MTIIEASALLYDYFGKNDSFCEDDFNNLRTEKLTESEKASVRGALEAFKESNLVRFVHIKSRDYWILERPYKSLSQSIDVSAPVANLISSMANNILSAANMSKDVNPLKITERDLMVLIEFINSLLENRKNKEESTEKEENK